MIVEILSAPHPHRPRFLLSLLALGSEFAVKFESKLSAAKFTHEFGAGKFAFKLGVVKFTVRSALELALEFISENVFTPKFTFRLAGCPLFKFALALRMFLKFSSAPRTPFKILSTPAALKFEFKFTERSAALEFAIKISPRSALQFEPKFVRLNLIRQLHFALRASRQRDKTDGA